jgi:hypothetical protein
MENGYVRIYRTLTKKGYYTQSEYVHLWVHLIMKATYRDKEFLFNNKIEHLTAGQFIAGRKILSKETGIQESKVERILKCFETEHQIEQQSFNKFRIISILNWNEYQVNEQQNEQQVNNQRTASEQPVNTNKKDNKYKKEKNTYTSDFLSFWKTYPNKVGKDAAWNSWKKRNGSLPEISFILTAIENQKQSVKWQKDEGQFIPNPATWINQGRWNDETCEHESNIDSWLKSSKQKDVENGKN